jgi:hypothetical protein
MCFKMPPSPRSRLPLAPATLAAVWISRILSTRCGSWLAADNCQLERAGQWRDSGLWHKIASALAQAVDGDTIASTVTSAASSAAGGTIEVVRGSTLHLIGANVISNTTVGPALEAYSNSFFRADDGTGRGFPAGIDSLVSAGDSVLIGDLSTGLFKEGAITGGVAVEERGVLRMEKGADTLTITGGITLSQGSTGFFSGVAGSIGTGAPLTCVGPTSNASNPAALSSGNANCPPI